MGYEGKENAVANLSNFTSTDHELLIRIVKECQRSNCSGSFGIWKQYLATQVDHKASPGPNDPAKRPWQVLAGFLESLSKEDDLKLVERIRKWSACRAKAKEADKADPWPSTPIQELVLRTRQHPRYGVNYNLPSFGEDWVVSDRVSPTATGVEERLLAVDCEMGVGEGQTRELLRVAVVEGSGKVVLSELVKPSRAVVDYKTAITGVKPADMKEVAFSQADAQKAVKSLLTPGTVLVGHGLHHDLRVLKVDCARVIDTSLIFSYAGLEGGIPSLQDLALSLLKNPIRVGPLAAHDSEEDARAALELVKKEMAEGPLPPLLPPSTQVEKTELTKLFLHKLPRGTTPADLAAMFPADPAPPHVQMITWGSAGVGTTFAVFGSTEQANRAFRGLVGGGGKDSLGRPQKSVELKGGGGMTVRKMGCHNGTQFGVDLKKGTAGGTKTAGRPQAGQDKASETAGTPVAEGVAPSGREGGAAPGEEGRGEKRGAEGGEGEEVAAKKAKATHPIADAEGGGGAKQVLKQVRVATEGATEKSLRKKKSKVERALRRAAARGEVVHRADGAAALETGMEKPSWPLPTGDTRGAGGAVVGNGVKGGGEVDVLKHKLAERDSEVAALQRLVTELARRQSSH